MNTPHNSDSIHFMDERGGTEQSRESLLQAFVTWSAAHITGDEKGQAQIFLDRLFQAFGQRGSLDVGGTAEMRIRKASEDGGGTSFADYVWKPVVLIEMKKRGADLSKHYRQDLRLLGPQAWHPSLAGHRFGSGACG